MVTQTQLALRDAAEWLGDWHPLAEQLGSADGLLDLVSVSVLLELQPVHNLTTLRQLLQRYQIRYLLPIELPAIQLAHGHASRHELRELVALDQELAARPALKRFAAPSHRIGRTQLQKLRPLRDERVVQRYLNAVESGQAHGWHTLVYGLTLAVYSLPLRQGLLGYGHQITRGFIYRAARKLRLSERECRSLFEELCAEMPAAVEAMVAKQSPIDHLITGASGRSSV
jgi:urease accessory protein UreF